MESKHLTILFLALLLLLSCNNKSKPDYIIGVSQCSNDEWRQEQNQAMVRETAFYPNLKLEIKTVKDNNEEQIHDIRTFIEQKVDLLIISPNEAEALTPIVEEAYNKNIPVILIERKTTSDNYTTFVGADNLEVGRTAGAYIAGLLKGKGNVLEIRGLKGSTSDAGRHQGFVEEVGKHSGIHIVGSYDTEWYREDAEWIMKDFLSREYPVVDLIFAMSDRMALGVHNVVSKEKDFKPVIVGIDALPGENNGIANIIAGKINASIIYPTGGDKIIQTAMDILEGRPYQKENFLSTAIVDQSNARVITMQNEQLLEHQTKLKRMNDMLDHSVELYANQQTMFYGTILILILISITLLVSFFAYRSKNKANKLLAKQNSEIKKQAEELALQKEQLIKLSQDLEEATQEKLIFFTNISHELKTPLSLILGPVETLAGSKNLTKEQRDLLNLSIRNSERLLRLINEIIEFRTFDNNKLKGYFSEADMKHFLDDLNVVFIDFAKRKQVKFSFASDRAEFNMFFDKEKMEKIYYNLLSNAFKFVNSEGRVSVSLSGKNVDGTAYAELSVFNSGSSIAKEEVNNIFNRFYKVNPHDAGTGIGLALTSALVKVHSGEISVESSEESGTVFRILLPVIHEETLKDASGDSSFYKNYTQSRILLEEQLHRKKSRQNVSLEDSKPLVLIIEDNADMRSYLELVLKEDYNVIEAENGEEGLERAIKYIPDVIISDVMMPVKDGFELCKTLKEHITTSHIPIILLTANSLDEQKAIGFESGADAYIAKPFNAGLFKIRLRKLIENREKIKKAFAGSLIDESKKTSLGGLEQQFIDKFTQYVENNISNSELSVDDVARELGMSRVQLYRKIKSLANSSPNELIRIIRLKQAKLLLASKTMTISEVAYETGFSSPSYFSKCFKEFFNDNPTDYIAAKEE